MPTELDRRAQTLQVAAFALEEVLRLSAADDQEGMRVLRDHLRALVGRISEHGAWKPPGRESPQNC